MVVELVFLYQQTKPTSDYSGYLRSYPLRVVSFVGNSVNHKLGRKGVFVSGSCHK